MTRNIFITIEVLCCSLMVIIFLAPLFAKMITTKKDDK